MIEEDKKIDTIIGLLKRQYLTIIILLVILLVMALFKITPFFPEKESVSVVLERYIIVLSIIAIPGSLKLFANLLKKVPRGIDIELAIRKYRSAYNIRLYTLSALALLNIILFDYSANLNFFWITIVIFILFFYCKPSFPELERLIDSEKSNDNSKNGVITVDDQNEVFEQETIETDQVSNKTLQ